MSYFPLSTVSFWLRSPLRSARNQKGCRCNRGYGERQPFKNLGNIIKFYLPEKKSKHKKRCGKLIPHLFYLFVINYQLSNLNNSQIKFLGNRRVVCRFNSHRNPFSGINRIDDCICPKPCSRISCFCLLLIFF